VNSSANTSLAFTSATEIPSLSPTMKVLVNLNNTSFASPSAYSYKVGTGFAAVPNFSSFNVPNSQFTFTGGSATNASLTGDALGNLYLNFTPAPIPEPGTILGIGALALGLGYRWRRRKIRATSSPA
jgi:hypothetical protein